MAPAARGAVSTARSSGRYRLRRRTISPGSFLALTSSRTGGMHPMQRRGIAPSRSPINELTMDEIRYVFIVALEAVNGVRPICCWSSQVSVKPRWPAAQSQNGPRVCDCGPRIMLPRLLFVALLKRDDDSWSTLLPEREGQIKQHPDSIWQVPCVVSTDDVNRAEV